jgi:hypothetical protein
MTRLAPRNVGKSIPAMIVLTAGCAATIGASAAGKKKYMRRKEIRTAIDNFSWLLP